MNSINPTNPTNPSNTTNPSNPINSSNSTNPINPSNSLTPRYVVITPVRNEAPYIGKTIESMVRQTILPQEWIIVDDGSTDQTPQIIDEASHKYSWIRILRLAPRCRHSFGAVVNAIEAGVGAIMVNDYQYLAIIDADVRFEPNYFHSVFERFEALPALGLAGGMVVDVNERRKRKPINREDVPGATQVFRRDCFEAIGRLIPVPEGGWDTLTCVCARMRGYKTQLFTDLIVEHMKPRNSSQGGLLHRIWQRGIRDHVLGYNFVYECFKCIYRISDPPPVIGAATWFGGYLTASLIRKKISVNGDLLQYMRKEQIKRLKKIFKKFLV